MPGTTRLSRRTFLKTSGWLGMATALGGLGFSFHEVHEITVERVRMSLDRLPAALDGFRLVQISDIHFDDFTHEHHLRQTVETINAERPDLVVITGDFVSAPSFGTRKQAAANVWPCAKVLTEIRSKHGTCAVFGNHDYRTNVGDVNEALSQQGVTVLRNRSMPVEAANGRIWVAGIDDALHGRPDVSTTLAGIPPDECVIAAVHEPDYADVVCKHPVDMQISGHSHGGQIRLPFVGAPYLPELARKYPMGTYRVGKLQLYTNRGIGVILLPLRFMSPPEVTVFTLRAAG